MKLLAKVSGLAYLMIFLSGFYANFAVLEGLIETNNVVTTTQNFIENQSQFRNGIIGFLVMLFFDVLLVWSLFGLTESVSKQTSYIASFFRVLHALFFCLALFQLWQVYPLTSDASNSLELQNKVMYLISNFDTLWTVGLIFFGIHLIVLGYLILKSTKIPKALGILLILAAIGYIVDGMAKLFMPNYADYKDVFEIIVVMPSVIGEFSFTVWLLIKGFGRKQFTIQTAQEL
jgi:hypothetical protein